MTDNYGEILKKLRKSKNLTQAQVAEILCYSPSTICKYENEKAIPPRDILIKYCRIFHVELSIFGVDEGGVADEIKEAHQREIIRKASDCLKLVQELETSLTALIATVAE